jgi:hypothetical protein
MGVSVSQVTGEAQTVLPDGRVFMHGHHVGTTQPPRKGWTTWGLEAAGAPFMPPTSEEQVERELTRLAYKNKRAHSR